MGVWTWPVYFAAITLAIAIIGAAITSYSTMSGLKNWQERMDAKFDKILVMEARLAAVESAIREHLKASCSAPLCIQKREAFASAIDSIKELFVVSSENLAVRIENVEGMLRAALELKRRHDGK